MADTPSNPGNPQTPQPMDRFGEAVQKIDPAEAAKFESGRVADRRANIGLAAGEHPAPKGRWGLALSGGGIRSATFCLGVLQGLGASVQDAKSPKKPLLWFFDYLSTVSGGGYVGAFFCSLFIPGRLSRAPNETKKAAAEQAYRVFAYDPPGRMHASDSASSGTTGQLSLAWLRDNGRYLAPSGSGDMFHTAALALRNWLSLHYVMGTLFMAAFAFVALLRAGTASHWGDFGSVEVALLERALDSGCVTERSCPLGATRSVFDWTRLIWWSTLFALPLFHLLAITVPWGVAYWISHPNRGYAANSLARHMTMAAVAGVIVVVIFFGLAWIAHSYEWGAPAFMLLATAVIVVIALLMHVVASSRDLTVAMQRIYLTRKFSRSLAITLVLLALATADTVGQTLYRMIMDTGAGPGILSLPVILGAIVWTVRKASRFFDQKEAKGFLSKIPVAWIAGAAGVLMLVAVLLFWQLLVQWMQWRGGPPDPAGITDRTRAYGLGAIAVASILLAWITGLFPGFINLSSLQQFYGSRLTRTYLGGSNGERFQPGKEELRTATEPHQDDELSHGDYYLHRNAPLHLINTTMNLTSDRAEQVVQRDRKGKPLAVIPDGFSLDGTAYKFAQFKRPFENQQPMKIGQWIGTSGAAFTTGLGRSTSLGLSLALGLANVRLGTWWDSGLGQNSAHGLERQHLKLFKSQTYIGYELLAAFHGTKRRWQYLSDGGHFENTGLYELLRLEREVGFAVVCDCGCDPGYQFNDLANLVRLARIDHRIEIEVVSDFRGYDELAKVFGQPSEFTPAPGDKCALLLQASPVDADGVRQPVSMVVVLLKPRVIPQATVDVREYRLTHEAFPQEPTADQFFDEAQWESYRKLGRTIATQVFGGAVGPQLWDYLRTKYPNLVTT